MLTFGCRSAPPGIYIWAHWISRGLKSQLTSTQHQPFLIHFLHLFSPCLLTMVDSRPSSTDEKVTVVNEHKSKGFFSRKKAASDDEKSSIGDGNVVAEVKPAEEIPAIGFTDLFRLVLDSFFVSPPSESFRLVMLRALSSLSTSLDSSQHVLQALLRYACSLCSFTGIHCNPYIAFDVPAIRKLDTRLR